MPPHCWRRLVSCSSEYPKALGGRPHLARLVFRIVPDATSRLTAILTCSAVGDSVRAALRAAADVDAAAPATDSTSRFWSTYDRSKQRLRDTFDRARCEREARRVAGHGVWQVPRLIDTRSPQALRDVPDAEARYLWPGARAARQQKLDRVRRDSTGAIRRLAALEREIVGVLHEAGVPLLLGTESHVRSGVWGFSAHDELAALVEAGLTPARATSPTPRRSAPWC